ncbi:MAG: hypothetical protein R3F59_16190 [Myxococcota bacterium]
MSQEQQAADALTHARLQRRQQEVHDRHRRAVEKVGELLDTQRRVGAELGQGLEVLSRQRTELETLDRRETDASLLAALVRPFVGRRHALARRSIAEGLLQRYEQVSVRLREATAFSDELRLCALELQAEVDQLHRELAGSLQQQQAAAARVLEIERGLEELEESVQHTPEQKARLRDRYTFDLRSESVSLALFGAAVELSRQHLDPARALRDTVLRLHEEMATYVLSATHTVNAAGRRIGAMGMLADAPAVVAELQQSLDALGLAMEATTQWIDRSQRFIAEVLPELSTRVQREAVATEQALAYELQEHDRDRIRLEAERTLRREAEDEVARLLGDEQR